ncbi:hypothetical protein DXD67_10835 [Coprococcus comes]|uniref:Uncharacterized protein n=1 Tax=Coprococcus comes TaxID=410072 RepID=A0A3E4GNW4_9FIRM|nr:hypothetical protein [Coprococcus comes]RGJ22445.1 hypothetical protein DXD67_10835 [Coprococcus comes]
MSNKLCEEVKENEVKNLKDSWSYCSYGILHWNDGICSTKPGSFYSCYSCKQRNRYRW